MSTPLVIRYAGIGLLAVGTALLLFWFFLDAFTQKPILSPIPEGDTINVIYITPAGK